MKTPLKINQIGNVINSSLSLVPYHEFSTSRISCPIFSLNRYYKIVSSPEGYSVILSKLRDEGISFEPDNGYELLPVNPVEV